ncbi:MAG: prephenate dehydrogenase [Gemmatimonadota bacterium]
MRPESLAVLGLGAIGGAVAWQARLAGVPRVIGYSPDPSDGMLALKSAALTDLADSPARAVRNADLVVIAAPPLATLELLDRIAGWLPKGAMVTDVTSIKGPVVARAAAAGLAERFAGSHPLAGTHASGFGAARSDLMRGTIVYVTPAGPDPAPVREIMDFWSGTMEAEPVQVTATGHDEQLAWTSHLPQAAAYALAAVLARRKGVSFGTGARDTTRLAASSARLWTELFQLNGAAILPAIEELERELAAMRQLIAGPDPEPLGRYLDQIREFRRGLER